MSVFRPCIDLHHGQVKQIVGGSLDTDNLRTNFVSPSVSNLGPSQPSHQPPQLIPQADGRLPAATRLRTLLKCTANTTCVAVTSSSSGPATTPPPRRLSQPGRVSPAPTEPDSSGAPLGAAPLGGIGQPQDTLLTAPLGRPDRLHVGGGITDANAQEWLEAGAEKVIVTSYLFPNATYSPERLRKLVELVGKERLVVDVSCRKRGDKWVVAMNRWQDLTDMQVNRGKPSLFHRISPHHRAQN